MNPNINALLSQIRLLLVLLGGAMVELGLDHLPAYKYITVAAGSIVVIGNAVWGIWSAYANYRKASAIGVQAGINLTASGAALAADGKTVVSINDGSTPPKAVTIATAAEIVKDFGPTSIAKA